jgi:hypothetical protein
LFPLMNTGAFSTNFCVHWMALDPHCAHPQRRFKGILNDISGNSTEYSCLLVNRRSFVFENLSQIVFEVLFTINLQRTMQPVWGFGFDWMLSGRVKLRPGLDGRIMGLVCVSRT